MLARPGNKTPGQGGPELFGDRVGKQIRQHRRDDHIRVPAGLPAVAQALAHERPVYPIELAHKPAQVPSAVAQRAQLLIRVRWRVTRIAGKRSEIQTPLTHQILKAPMRNDSNVMAGCLESDPQRHIRANVALRTESDDSNTQIALSAYTPPQHR